MRLLSPTQIKLLRSIYAEDGPLLLEARHRRTVNALVKKGFVTADYVAGPGVADSVRVRKRASVARVEREIERATR